MTQYEINRRMQQENYWREVRQERMLYYLFILMWIAVMIVAFIDEFAK